MSMALRSSSSSPPLLDIHTPTSSFTIVHSFTQDNLISLFDKLSRKTHTDYHGERVGPGWLKYEWNDTIWNLDDDSDYTIFVWRQQQTSESQHASLDSSEIPSSVLHLQNPSQPLPTPPAYLNPTFYLFRPSKAIPDRPHSAHSSHRTHSPKSRKSRRGRTIAPSASGDAIPEHKRNFQQFQEENGVRTVLGSIGPVNNVRMLLKSGYRHVYISRKFAIKHGFIPHDAAPGHYGYGGLVNIGQWPITVISASSTHTSPSTHADAQSKKGNKPKPTLLSVYLSEEQHFDVVLGRSFFERRQIQINTMDPTEVICLDTGEKLECELVILKDGRGEILTVT